MVDVTCRSQRLDGPVRVPAGAVHRGRCESGRWRRHPGCSSSGPGHRPTRPRRRTAEQGQELSTTSCAWSAWPSSSSASYSGRGPTTASAWPAWTGSYPSATRISTGQRQRPQAPPSRFSPDLIKARRRHDNDHDDHDDGIGLLTILVMVMFHFVHIDWNGLIAPSMRL